MAVSLAGCGSSTGGGTGGPHARVFVAAQHGGEVDVVGLDSMQKEAAWKIGGDPHILAYDARHHLLWVSSPKAGTVRALDTGSGSVVATVSLKEPDALALTPDGATLLATSGLSGPGTIAFIDVASRQVVHQLPVGNAPHAIAVSPDGARAYVADQFSNDVAVLDLPGRRLLQKIPVPGVPYHLALRDGRLYVTRLFDGKVSAIDVATGRAIAEYTVGEGPSQVAVSADGSRLFVADKGLAFIPGSPIGGKGTDISVIDLAAGTPFTVKVGEGPDAVLIAGGYVLVSALGSNELDRLDAATYRLTRVGVGSFPTGLAFAPA
jgi:YVTN family beta-propeller protein